MCPYKVYNTVKYMASHAMCTAGTKGKEEGIL